MIKHTLLFALCSTILLSCSSENQSENKSTDMKITAPVCKIVPHEMTIHGDTRIDNYFWLNQREDQNVIDYLNAENDYTEAQLAGTNELQKSLYSEMKNRIKEEDESVPYFLNGYYYQTQYIEGGEYPIYARATKLDFSDKEILLDGNQMAEGFEYFDIAGFEVSPNNELIAFATDTVSRRLYNIQIKNLKTGEIFPETLPNADGSFAWANDNKTLFYSAQNPITLRSEKIMKHTLGEIASDDKEVYFEADETFSTSVYRSKSNAYLMIECYSTLTTEFSILSADTPDEVFQIFHPRTKGLEYSVYPTKDDSFFIVTNKDGSTNFKLMYCDKTCTTSQCWKEVIPHRDTTLLQYITLFDQYMVLAERSNGLVNLRVRSYDGTIDYYVPFNDETYVAYTSGNAEFNTNKLRFWYSSLTTPGTTYAFDMETKEQEVLKQQEVLGGQFDPNNYTSKRLYATARDGVKVPISLVYKNTTELSENTPLLQYAYGSYGSSEDPYFSSSRLSILDRGFVFAIAHIRGGEDLGRQWYEDGKLLKKWNTFNDFIDCSKFLIDNEYTSANHLYAMGGSAGGLLMGVVANEAPELYNGVIAQVPFVDVVTTMLDETIPLTTGEYDEWGNPNNKEYYEYMLSYSPYDQVSEQAYPNMLITTGLHDSQVQYWEPAKWTAKLRVNNSGDNMILLHTNMSTGHGGASGRFEYLKEIAQEYAFMLMLEE